MKQMSQDPLQPLYTHEDIITSITSSGLTPNHFITASLDGVIKLFDITTLKVLQELKVTPILDSIFVKQKFYIGCVDGSVRCVDFENHMLQKVGRIHSKGVSSITASGDKLICGSWDKTIQLIDLKSNSSEFIEMPQKILSLDCKDNMLVVAMTERRLYVYNLEDLTKPWQIRESGLQHQIRSVSCFQQGFAVSSIEGKASIEYYNDQGNYAFRCHRVKDVVNSVNYCLVCNEKKLYTAGDDGNIIEWDLVEKKRIKDYSFQNRNISKFIITTNGQFVVTSDDQVYMRNVNR